jgi:hypothetical protein
MMIVIILNGGCVHNYRVPDAVQRAISAFTRVFDTLWLLRRAGTHTCDVSNMGLGLAAHRFALRSIRGTPAPWLYAFFARIKSENRLNR